LPGSIEVLLWVKATSEAKKKTAKTLTGQALADRLTQNFQKEIRNSESWEQMVEQFREERAKEILKECKAEAKPGE
jgi:uncharacterized protein YaaW (UPF0174 family)